MTLKELYRLAFFQAILGQNNAIYRLITGNKYYAYIGVVFNLIYYQVHNIF